MLGCHLLVGVHLALGILVLERVLAVVKLLEVGVVGCFAEIAVALGFLLYLVGLALKLVCKLVLI